MTNPYQKKLEETLESIWGRHGFTTWVEPAPLTLPPFTPQQANLLKAAISLLNWNAPRFNSFLKEKLVIGKIEDLPASQIDNLFDLLNAAIADWQNNRIPGKPTASISSLSSRYWEARLALYPQSVPARKRRKKWLLDGYESPGYSEQSQPVISSQKETIGEWDADDWLRFEYREDKYWYAQ